MNHTRLLIAEDDLHVAFAVREFFCEQGFDVDCVIGLAEAERMLDRFPYSVLLTDLHLSKHQRAEGLSMIGSARARQPKIRTIVMTGFVTPQIEHDARRLGADAVLSKPISLPELHDVVMNEMSAAGAC